MRHFPCLLALFVLTLGGVTVPAVLQGQRSAVGAMNVTVQVLAAPTTIEVGRGTGFAGASTLPNGQLRVHGAAACRLIARLNPAYPGNADIRVRTQDGSLRAVPANAEGLVIGLCTDGRRLDGNPAVEVNGRSAADSSIRPLLFALEVDAGN